jgi:hypothetical protein
MLKLISYTPLNTQISNLNYEINTIYFTMKLILLISFDNKTIFPLQIGAKSQLKTVAEK